MDEVSGWSPDEMATLFRNWQAGDREALDGWVEILDTTFKKITHNKSETLQDSWFRTTDLLNEVFVSLLSDKTVEVEQGRHFFNFISTILRNLLVEEIRKLKTDNPGDNLGRNPGEDHGDGSQMDVELILAVHESLEDLRKEDETTAEVVNLRFFFGYAIEKISELLEMPFNQVHHRWKFAKVWLFHRLSPSLRHEFRSPFNRDD